ncbi:hypothetical protein FVR03_09685 [Pontibacter qinzhouensis]|uniref:Uncharacterized protein n=1 Tax=Pontibacter qinzhouensis TaxID=2603253 RepID=A0A5C8K6A6_9BACT|nr:polysialyltransferase family glycosyltransferase [Pontibacter qinzhouensis]TXK47109.1 hypothetical protein FVR03_09685 [Pontibacter qinzhouensis]
MSVKPNILIVGNYNREDVVTAFHALITSFNLYFAEFISYKEETSNYYKTFGKAVYWSDYNNAFDLLAQIKPHKVLFIFIESYHHMALSLACKQLGIKTIIIDHGLRDENINMRLAKFFVRSPKKTSLIKRTSKVVKQFKERLRGQLFLIRTKSHLEKQYQEFFTEFCKIRSRIGYEKTVIEINSPLCLPNAYISFSEKNSNGHFPFYLFSHQFESYFIGIPLFDSLPKINKEERLHQNILFIDQGLNCRNLLGWTDSNYSNFLSSLSYNPQFERFKFYIKLHPTQTVENLYLVKNKNFELIDDNKLINILPSTYIIIGFFSTYLLPLAAMEHTTVITLENHPVGKLDVSKSFIDAGVAHPVYNMQELDWALQHIDQLHQQQLPNKPKFTEDWLYKFDGKSGERLRDILLQDT